MNPEDIKDDCPYTNESMKFWLRGYYGLDLCSNDRFIRMDRKKLWGEYKKALKLAGEPC